MLKKISLLLLLSCYLNVFTQINADLLVNIHSVADTVEMNAIANPEKGVLVFNTDKDSVFVYNGTMWITQKGDIEHQPYVAIYSPVTILKGNTTILSIYGSNFTLNTQLAIASSAGILHSFTVESPRLIKANFTANNTIGLYDIEVSENGNTNTAWAGNSTNKLEIWGYNGSTKERAGTTCKSILDDNFSIGDTVYWINPDGGTTDNAFQVDCDMTTDGGGWTKVEYAYDFYLENFWTSGDARRWLNSNFTLHFSNTQINNIRNASTEAKQTYTGFCDGVLHYQYNTGGFQYAAGFRYHTGYETNYGSSTYINTTISVISDGCKSNSGSAPNSIFEINDIRLPIINISTRDNGNNGERFGSPLTANPAWFR